MYNDIVEGLDNYVSSLSLTIEQTLEMYLLAHTLHLELLTKIVEFFHKKASIMATLYHQLKVKTCCLNNSSKQGNATCWKIIITLVCVMFSKFRKTLVIVERLYNFPNRANALYIWGVQAHRVMADIFSSDSH